MRYLEVKIPIKVKWLGPEEGDGVLQKEIMRERLQKMLTREIAVQAKERHGIALEVTIAERRKRIEKGNSLREV